jgi:DNA polymerase-3 subunit delta'
LIDDAAYMTREAANSILKILEEPLGNTIFVLVTRDPSRILSTIRSRVWEVKFWPVSPARLVSGLVERGVSARKSSLAANLAHGLPGRAITYAGLSEAEIKDIQKTSDEMEALCAPGHLAERLRAVAACEERDEYAHLLAEMLGTASYDFDKKLRALADPMAEEAALAHTCRQGEIVRRLLALETELPHLYANMRLAFESAMISMR